MPAKALDRSPMIPAGPVTWLCAPAAPSAAAALIDSTSGDSAFSPSAFCFVDFAWSSGTTSSPAWPSCDGITCNGPGRR